MEDAAAEIIHDIDMKLILALQSFSRDVKKMMVVLPYYPRCVNSSFFTLDMGLLLCSFVFLIIDIAAFELVVLTWIS